MATFRELLMKDLHIRRDGIRRLSKYPDMARLVSDMQASLERFVERHGMPPEWANVNKEVYDG